MAASASKKCRDTPEGENKVSQLPDYLNSLNLNNITPNDVVNLIHTPIRSPVVVRKSKSFCKIDDHRPGLYKMDSRPRGYALVVNNIDFHNEEHYPTRKGAENDERSIEELLKQLYFEVEVHRNKTHMEMRNIVNNFSQKQEFFDIDCVIVVFMSHGAEGHSEDDTEVMGTDGIGVKTKDIVSYFFSNHCPAMVDKPKIFLFQSCRGLLTDPGVTVGKIHYRTETDGKRSDVLKTIDVKARTISDVFIAHPVAPGRKANRDIYNGAWFIQALVKVFQSHAHDCNLDDLFKLVDREIRKMSNLSEANFQAVTITHMGWNRILYFNPGLCKVNGKVIRECNEEQASVRNGEGLGLDTVDTFKSKGGKNKKYNRLKDKRNGEAEEEREEAVGCCGAIFNCRLPKRSTS